MTSILKYLRDELTMLSEAELRKILVLLLEKMGFNDVKETHGTQEFGKDLVFYETNKLKNNIWYACVVKKGDVNQKLYSDIIRQINEAFKVKHLSISEGRVPIDKVIVVASGVFTHNAIYQIAESIDDNKSKNVEYWDLGDIAKYILENELQGLLGKQISVLKNKFNLTTEISLNSISNIKFLESDFGIQTDALDKFEINIRAKSRSFIDLKKDYIEEDGSVSVPVKYLPSLNDILTSKKPFLIQGIATSGKTSVLKKLGRNFLVNDPSGYVFYIELTKSFLFESSKLIDIAEEIYNTITNSEISLLSIKVEKVLFLLDGLDEVLSNKTKDNIINQIEELKNERDNFQFVLTSRFDEYTSSSPKINPTFQKFELLPLNVTEMAEIGNRILGSDNSISKNFIKLLKKSEIIKTFPKTPLTTILFAILFKEEKIDIKDLPKNLTELYSKFVDLFLNKWDKNKGISEQYKITEKEFVLKRVAQELLFNHKVSLSEDELLDLLEKMKHERPIEVLENPKDFLKSVCERSNILIRNEFDNSYRFFHLTLQEYMASTALTIKDEDILVENFFDNWWLNTNLFYTGKNPDSASVLERVSNFEIVPMDFDSRFSYIIHASKLLQTAHLWDNQNRKKTLLSILKVFDDFVKDIALQFSEASIHKFKNRTLLDVILWARNIFNEFLSSKQFVSSFDEIWKTAKESTNFNFSDITYYCLCYNLSTQNKSSDFLYDFIISMPDLNPRWYKIVDVDVNKKNLEVTNKKLSLKIRKKSADHREYIQRQFKERVALHFNSITGLRILSE
jgi:hypothetical protein